MKSYPFVLCSMSLVIFLISLILGGCKESNNDNNPGRYRLTGLLMYEGDVLKDSAIYTYQGDKLSECVDYSNYYQEPVHAFYNYPDENSIVVTSFNNTQKYEYSFINGQMTRMLISDLNSNNWEPQLQRTYQYQNEKLVEDIWYFGSDEGLKPATKHTYEYEGGKMIRSRIYYNYDSSWQESITEDATYTGNLITKIVQYAYSDSVYTEFTHTDLQYSGSLLTGYYYYYTNENEPDLSYAFTYDDHGNMVIQESPEQGTRIEYIYEEGNGNFQQLQQPGGGIGSGFVLPYPTK